MCLQKRITIILNNVINCNGILYAKMYETSYILKAESAEKEIDITTDRFNLELPMILKIRFNYFHAL